MMKEKTGDKKNKKTTQERQTITIKLRDTHKQK